MSELCVIGGCRKSAVTEELREGNPTPYIAAYCEDHRRPTLTLDPRPLRPHDSEEDINENIPFDQWWNEPRQIARLYRWLKMRDRLPEDPADFIENAWTWQQDFDDMCMWAGPA